jgi:photosystem II stability/assembly factor-like uncharacterized protein
MSTQSTFFARCLACCAVLCSLAGWADSPAWEKVTSGVSASLRAVSYYQDASANKLPWAVGDGGTILLSAADGSWWQARTSITGKLLDAFSPDGSLLLAAGEKGAVFVSQDAGQHWSKMSPKTSQTLHAVFGSREGSLLVAGEGGTLFRSDDFGGSWSAQTLGASGVLRGLSGRSTFGRESAGRALGAAFVVGDAGFVARLADDGVSWERLSPGTSQALYSVAVYDACQVFAVGDAGTNLFSKDCGKTWRALGLSTKEDLRRVVVEKDFRTLKARIQIASHSGHVFASNDGGLSWTQSDLSGGKPLGGFTSGPAGAWGVGESGVFWRPAAVVAEKKAAAQVASFKMSDLEVSGGLTAGYATSGLSAIDPTFCYKLALMRSPALQGEFRAKLVVLPAGEVFSVEVLSGLEKELDACITEKIKGVTFRASPDKLPTKVQFTLKLFLGEPAR